ncbi:MAG: response regulator transcription factor [Dehalococcoidales bacterium]|nr:response regulator transcription factor [Dehalococcoidales bacterium]
MKILLAENRPEVSSALKLILEEAAGLRVTTELRDSEELMQCIEFEHPDIMLVDWDLPGESGSSLLKKIRDKYSRPVIISLGSNTETMKLALDGGADGFISKSSLPQEVIATLIKCLEKKFPVYD